MRRENIINKSKKHSMNRGFTPTVPARLPIPQAGRTGRDFGIEPLARRAMPKFTAGFTLIEIMTVVVIVSILTTIAITAISASQTQARDVRRITDIKEIQIELALYFDENRNYPNTNELASKLVPNYMASLPTNPSGGSYSYSYDLSTKKYCIGVDLERLDHINVDGYKNCSLTGGAKFYETEPK